MVRQFTVEEAATVFAQLNLDDTDFREFLETLGEPALATAGLPEHLQRMIDDTFTSTWFSIQGVSGVVGTELGTRPGDPLADQMFNFIMAKVLRRLE